MFITESLVATAKKLGLKELAGSALPGERFTQVSQVIDLLTHATSPAAQHGARVLLCKMAAREWRLIRGAHRSPSDGTLHVTVEVGEELGVTRYHLRLDARSHVFDITTLIAGETQRPAGRQPWVGPGA